MKLIAFEEKDNSLSLTHDGKSNVTTPSTSLFHKLSKDSTAFSILLN